MNHQEEIPVWSYINIQLMYQLQIAQQNKELHSITLKELISRTEKHIDSNIQLAEFYKPINSGSVFSFLYSLLVVPKELFKSNDCDFFDDFKFDFDTYFNMKLGDEKLIANGNLMRILRNAISHVNYKIDQNNGFDLELWNINRRGIRDIEIRTDINKLGNFAVTIFKFYHKKVRRKK